jgi:branched-chain amino acid transport system ATP-binding protein
VNLRLSDIWAQYGQFTVLNGIDLDVPGGDLRVIIGLNGAGKSTMAKCMFGLLKVTRGTVKLGDSDITNAPPRTLLNLGIAYVPQRPSIFPQLSVEDNLEMGLFQVQRDYGAALEGVFNRFELLARRRRTLAQALSGGERRLLEIARALMVNPRILILDEPSLGLSPRMLDTIFGEVKRINSEGVTVILIEQRIRAALTIAKSLSVLRLGRVAFSGDPQVAADPRRLSELLSTASEKVSAA